MRKERETSARSWPIVMGIVGLLMHVAGSVAFPQGQTPATGATRPTAAAGGAASADLISLNFSGADLVEVIHVLARHLRLNYTIDPDVKGSVTIFSGEPIKKEDLLPIFHEILRMNNAVAVKRGNLYRISAISEGIQIP